MKAEKARLRTWLRHRVTSQKVAGSIPDCVMGNFLLRNPSVGLTQPLTETFLGSKGGHCVGPTTVQHSYANCLEISGPVKGLLYVNFVLRVNNRKYGMPYVYFKL